MLRNLKYLMLMLLCVSSWGIVNATPRGWTDNYEKAKNAAVADKKIILLFFTGSDWCGYCMKFVDTTLEKSGFLSKARKMAVLVEVDFPKQKKQSKALVMQNNSLKRFATSTGYPNLVAIDNQENVLGTYEGDREVKSTVKWVEDMYKLSTSKEKSSSTTTDAK